MAVVNVVAVVVVVMVVVVLEAVGAAPQCPAPTLPQARRSQAFHLRCNAGDSGTEDGEDHDSQYEEQCGCKQESKCQ